MSAREHWTAVAVDDGGFVLTDDDLRGWADAIRAGKSGWGVPCEPPTSIRIVKGSAMPEPQSDDPDEKFLRMPSSFYTDDEFVEIEDLDEEEPDRVLRLWELARAAAVGMNAEAAR